MSVPKEFEEATCCECGGSIRVSVFEEEARLCDSCARKHLHRWRYVQKFTGGYLECRRCGADTTAYSQTLRRPGDQHKLAPPLVYIPGRSSD